MTATDTLAAASNWRGGQPYPGTRWLLGALALTQTVGYGVLYSAFAVVLVPMTIDLRASTTAVTGALTLSVLVSAAAAIPVGRWLDRHGGHGLMTTGSVLGTLAVLAWSQVDSLAALYIVFAAIGLASAMVFYEAAFAVIVAVHTAAQRPRALLAVTVVAGFASSIFIPVTGALADRYGWRAAVLVLAGIYGLLTIPAHALVLRSVRPQHRPTAPLGATDVQRRAVQAAVCGRYFWLLAAAFIAQGAATAVIAVHLVAYLAQLGHSFTLAAAVTGLLGVLSVTGRLVSTGLQRRYSTARITAAIFTLQGASTCALPLVGRSPIGAAICVTTFGLGFGVATIARPALIAEQYGTTGYASIAGTLALPITTAKATAPLAAAAVYTTAGTYTPVMYTVVAACLIAAALIWAASR